LLGTIAYLLLTLYYDINNYRNGTTHIINSVFGIILTLSGIPLYMYFRRRKMK